MPVQNVVFGDGQGPSGLNVDLPPWELPSSVITNGANFRLINGALASTGGEAVWSTGGMSTDLDFFLTIPVANVNMHLVAGKTGVWSFDGTTISRILTCNVSEPRGWTGTMLGGIPIINHPEIGAFYWFPYGHNAPLTALPYDNKGTGNVWNTAHQRSAQVIRSHRNYLFCLNLTEYNSATGTAGNVADGYRWSHPADINGLPPTWDETDPNYLAGVAQIGADSGSIVDGLSLRDAFVIYADKGINLLELSGDIYVWNRRQMTTNAGLLAKDCVAEVLGVHYLMTADDVVRFDGSRVESIMHHRMRKHLMANMDPVHYRNSQVVSNLDKKEVWFMVPTNGNTWPSLAYVYNWAEDTWGLRDLAPNTTYLAYGRVTTGAADWEDLQNRTPPSIWASYGVPWSSQAASSTPYTMVATHLDGQIHDVDPAAPDGTVTTFVERTDYQISGLYQATTITRVYPKIDGSSPVRITMGSQDTPGGPVRWKAPVVFHPVTDRRVNVRTTGALHCWRIESIDKGSFIISGIQFEYAEAGGR